MLGEMRYLSGVIVAKSSVDYQQIDPGCSARKTRNKNPPSPTPRTPHVGRKPIFIMPKKHFCIHLGTPKVGANGLLVWMLNDKYKHENAP